jgi:hypothetical protein
VILQDPLHQSIVAVLGWNIQSLGHRATAIVQGNQLDPHWPSRYDIRRCLEARSRC